MPSAPGTLLAPKPVEPVRAYSFTDWQVNNPTAPPPGDRLDSEFDQSNTAIGDVIDWTATSLNSDGTLRPGVVGQTQMVSGLFDDIAQGIVDDVQPMVDQAQSYATQALNAASAASSSAVQAANSASGSAGSAGSAVVSAATATTAAATATTAVTNSQNAATAAANSANHADGSETVAEAYADVGMAWAEHMPDIIPPNILAVQAVTGDHWSSRWWAHRASDYVGQIEDLIATRPAVATTYHYTYIATNGQTIFQGPDRDGHVLLYTPGPQSSVMVYENGLARTSVADFAATQDKVTFTTPCAAGDVVQIQVESVADTSGGGGVAGVASFNGRTGAVSLTLGDVVAVGGASLNGPAFTGNPTAPTPAPGDNDTTVATTAFVTAAVGALPTGVASFNTRVGAVALTAADVTAAGGALQSSLTPLAPINNPAFTGTVTVAQPGGIKGTVTSDSAAAGSVGEFISAIRLPNANVSLSNGVNADVIALALTPGDWDVWGNAAFQMNTATVPVYFIVATSKASLSPPATLGGGPTDGAVVATGTPQATNQPPWVLPVPSSRFSLAAAATVYLVVQAQFSGGACLGSGWIAARRVR